MPTLAELAQMSDNAYVGYPQLQRQANKMRLAQIGRIPENLPDPRTYGFVKGLTGTSPDELGMSVLSPNTAPAKDAAYYGYQLSNLGQMSPAIAPAGKTLLRTAGNAVNDAMVYGTGPLARITPQPMRLDVWHGSPHVFERFDASKVGTGEGAQMYGQGIYTAQSQDVAKRFTPRDITFENKLMDKYNQAEKAGDYTSMQIYEDFMAQKTPEEISASFKDMGFKGKDLVTAQKAFDTAKNLYQSQMDSALYKVNLPDTHIRRMLDWDTPIKDQPYHVRKLAKKLGLEMTDLGGDLAWKVGKDEAGKKALQEAGIPGIKYFDQMSNGQAKNERNFVVFDPEHLKILERNAKPIK